MSPMWTYRPDRAVTLLSTHQMERSPCYWVLVKRAQLIYSRKNLIRRGLQISVADLLRSTAEASRSGKML